MCVQGGQKSKPLPNYQNIVLNRTKPATEIRFIRQNKVSIKHKSIICWY